MDNNRLSKIVSLSEARRRLFSDETGGDIQVPGERRRESRRLSSERLFAQVVQSNEQDLVGITLSCRAVDVSANGLQILAERAVPAGCVLDLWVDDSRKPGKFFLSSDVRWVGDQRYDGWVMGVQLHNGQATDIEAWRKRNAPA